MTRPAADNVKVIWTGTGTGTMSLGAAVSGFQAFPSALDGQIVSYAIDHVGGVSPDVIERETGVGTYTASGTTLSRDIVTFSTAGAPTKTSFTEGTKHVRLVPLAQDIIENRAASDPTVNDDLAAGYIAGRSRWLNTSTKQLFLCVDHTSGAAVWLRLHDPKPTAVKNAAYTAVAGDLVRTDSSAGSFNVTLPAAPIDADSIAIVDTTGSWPTNAVTLLRNGKTIGGVADDVLLDGATRIDLIFNAADDDWGLASLGTNFIGGNLDLAEIGGSLGLNQVVAGTANRLWGYGAEGIGQEISVAGGATLSNGVLTVSSTGDTAPSQVSSDATPFALTDAMRAHLQVDLRAHAASVDFEVSAAATAGSRWLGRAQSADGTDRAGCTISVAGDAGSVNGSAGGSREIVAGGLWVAEVKSNAGSAPVVEVVGNVFEPDTSRGATTLSTAALVTADHQRSITITGTQTISLAVASIPSGFTAVYWASGADRTLDGLDADHIIPSGGSCTVHKNAAGALVASGAKTTSPGVTVLDAA